MRQYAGRAAASIMLALLTVGCASHRSSQPGRTKGRAQAVAPCRAAALSLGTAPPLAPMTGEHGDFYTLTNHGQQACTITGYPKVGLYDADGRLLPFHYAHQLRPYLLATRPFVVTIAPMASAGVLVVKYTCVLGDLRNAATIQLTLPGPHQAALTGPVASNGLGVSMLSYCRGGPDAPGQTAAVSPIEPANAAVLWDRIRGLPAPASPPPSQAAPICRTSGLKITIVRGGVAAGTIGGYLAFTNTGNTPCRLVGWPTVVAITAAGETSTATHVHTTMFGPVNPAVRSVTIRSGRRADAVFTGHDIPAGTADRCPPSYRQLRVTPPGNKQSAVIPAWLPAPALGIYMPACSQIVISQVVPSAALYHG